MRNLILKGMLLAALAAVVGCVSLKGDNDRLCPNDPNGKICSMQCTDAGTCPSGGSVTVDFSGLPDGGRSSSILPPCGAEGLPPGTPCLSPIIP